MLALLLDEHISPDVAEGLRRRHPSRIVCCIAEWRQGAFLGQPEAVCLAAAAAEGLTLVTYDRRSIPPLLKAWAEAGKDHGGVIFVDEKTISPANTRALIQALETLVNATGKWDWTDRVCFLRR